VPSVSTCPSDEPERLKEIIINLLMVTHDTYIAAYFKRTINLFDGRII
jgi:ABC-type lipoprotein export system ATPase subunit